MSLSETPQTDPRQLLLKWAYNGKIFALREDGDTFVIAAGPEYELLGKNETGAQPPAPGDDGEDA